MEKPIYVTRPLLPPLEEFVKELNDIWESKWFTNVGEKHKTFEKMLKEFLKVPFVTLVTNGHLALETAISSLEFQGEVITTPFTFVSTTHSIVRSGLTPVFCDINYEDYNINVDFIESLITDKTCAILPVHVYGNVCDVLKIEEIAKKYNLKVVYDSAHAFGVEINGVGIGNFGDLSTFSFHATKVFNTIEGGAIVCKDKSIKQKLEKIKNFGLNGPEEVDIVGINAKMNEIQSAMGICNLKCVGKEIENRKKVFDRYSERLDSVKGIKIPKIKDGVKHNFAYYPVLFDGYKFTRDQIYEKLRKHNVYTRKYFYPAVNETKCYKDKFKRNETPIAKYVSERILALPIYGDLPLEIVDEICDIIVKEDL